MPLGVALGGDVGIRYGRGHAPLTEQAGDVGALAAEASFAIDGYQVSALGTVEVSEGPDPEFLQRGRRLRDGQVAKSMAHPWATRSEPPRPEPETTPLFHPSEVGEPLALPHLRCVVSSTIDHCGGAREPPAESR